MTHDPNGEFDTMLTEGLRHRAATASRPSRGFSDVRRRYRRRRQQQVAVGLVPAVAGLGWLVTRPRTDQPLQPSGGGFVDCGDATVPTWTGTYPPTTVVGDTTPIGVNVTSTTITFDENGNVVDANGNPIGTTTTTLEIITDGNGNYLDANGNWVTLPFVTDASGYPVATLPAVLDSDGNPVVVDSTWVGDVSTTTTSSPADSTTTTVCVPTSDTPTTSTGETTNVGDSTTTTSIVISDLTGTKVQVANCSVQNGVAGMMSQVLIDAGFTTADPVNGTCDPKLEISYVIYDGTVPGAQAVAGTLARMLGGITVEAGVLPIKTESGTWADGSGVVLLLGNDLAGKTLDQITNPTTTIAQP